MEQLVLIKVGLMELGFVLLTLLGLRPIMVILKLELGKLKVGLVVELVQLKVILVVEQGLLMVDPVEELVQLMVALEKLVLIFMILVPT